MKNKKTTLFAEIIIFSAIIHYSIFLFNDIKTSKQQLFAILILIFLSYLNKVFYLFNDRKVIKFKYGLGDPDCNHKFFKSVDGAFQCEKCGARIIKKEFN